MTHTIQPPILAWAWRIVVGDPREEPRIAAHHDWLREHRDLDGDGLLWLIQPDESGMDASPKFDHVWGPIAQGRPLFPLLIARNRRHGWDARRVRPRARGLRGHDERRVVAERAGARAPVADAGARRAAVATPRAGRFPRRRARRGGRAPRLTGHLGHARPARAARPAATRSPSARRARAARARATPTAIPLPAVAIDDPSYSERETWWGRHRHWRGPSWVNSAWFVTLGLRRLGLDDEADAMAQRLAAGHGARGLPRVLRVAQRAGDGRARLRLVDIDRRDARPHRRMTSRPLRGAVGQTLTLAVGIVGCGAVARHHVPALRAARGTQLAAAFDVDASAAAATGAPVAASLGDLIERVDLVAVCTPPDLHADVAVAALEAGRGVLVEKPLATTLADADRIVAAADGRLAATGFQLRCHRKLPGPRSRDQRRLGRPVRVVGPYGRPTAGPRGAPRGPVAHAARRRG